MSKYRKYPSYRDSGVEWLGNVPNEWKVTRLGNLGALTASGIDKKLKEDEPFVHIINFADIHKAKDRKLTKDTTYMKVTAPIDKKIAHQVNKGDLIFTPSSETIEDIGISALVEEELADTAFSYHVLRFHFTTPLNHDYRKYITNNTLSLAQFSMKARGTTRQTLGRDDFKTINLVLPPLKEQQTIANYLDKATAKIDTLIEKQTKLIELLKEKRQAVISTAVTRGLDNRVAMKDSGVEWLGEIPEHWEVGLLSSLFNSNKNKNSDLTHTNLLSLSYGRIIRKDINSAKGLLPENFNTYQVVKEGYIILRLTDLQNDKKSLRTGYVNEEGIITSAYIGLAKKSASIGNEKYFHLYLHTFDIYKGFYGMGAGVRQGLNFDELKKLKFALPPHAEQNEIVEYVGSKTKEIDNLISKSTKAIDLLKEKRTALISAAVIGKIDVREIA